jgi:uncharacterized protein (AIM24 family)
MQGHPHGQPFGQALEIVLSEGESLMVHPDLVAWRDDDVQEEWGTLTTLSSIAQALRQNPSSRWVTLEGNREGARLGLAGPWGFSLCFESSPPPILVRVDSLAGASPSARIHSPVKLKALGAAFCECPSEEPLILMGKGGLIQHELGLGEAIVCRGSLVVAMDADLCQRLGKKQETKLGMVRLVGPGIVWTQGAQKAKVQGERGPT